MWDMMEIGTIRPTGWDLAVMLEQDYGIETHFKHSIATAQEVTEAFLTGSTWPARLLISIAFWEIIR